MLRAVIVVCVVALISVSKTEIPDPVPKHFVNESGECCNATNPILSYNWSWYIIFSNEAKNPLVVLYPCIDEITAEKYNGTDSEKIWVVSFTTNNYYNQQCEKSISTGGPTGGLTSGPTGGPTSGPTGDSTDNTDPATNTDFPQSTEMFSPGLYDNDLTDESNENFYSISENRTFEFGSSGVVHMELRLKNDIFSIRNVTLELPITVSNTTLNITKTFILAANDANKFQTVVNTTFICKTSVPMGLLPNVNDTEITGLNATIYFQNFKYWAFSRPDPDQIEECPRDKGFSHTIPIATGVSILGAGVLGILALLIPRLIKKMKS